MAEPLPLLVSALDAIAHRSIYSENRSKSGRSEEFLGAASPRTPFSD